MPATKSAPREDDERSSSGVRRSAAGPSASQELSPSTGGMSITTSFLLSVGLAVLIASIASALLNFTLASGAAETALDLKGASAARNLAQQSGLTWQAQGDSYTLSGVDVQPARITRRGEVVDGVVYRAYLTESSGVTKQFDVVTDSAAGEFRSRLVVSLVGTSAIIVLVGVGVAYLLSRRIVGPLTGLIEDVRILSHGNLDHRVRVQSSGEVGLLAKSVDRMIRGLRDAQAAQREQEKAQHDLQIAAEIRSSLLPEKTPDLQGFEVSALSAAADSVGGDLYDFVDAAGGMNALSVVVAGISTQGVPGAMLMTMARANLHAALEREASPAGALKAANRPITRDMRRGLFVTAMAATVEPTGRVRIASAGHKAPAFLWRAATKAIESVHPEGIALGFDPGPVFDRTMREVEVTLAPGDRLVLLTAGAFSVRNEDDQELGEAAVQELVKKHGGKASDAFTQLIGSEVERFRGDAPLSEDLMIVTIRRKPAPGPKAPAGGEA